jgi:putative spermidine/putrescine transport system permease protein
MTATSLRHDTEDLSRRRRGPRLRVTLTGALTWGGLWVFVGRLLLAVGSVILASLAQRFSTGWLPEGYTTGWYRTAWIDFGLGGLLLVTVEVAVAVVLISLVIALPTAYVLSRLTFPVLVLIPFVDQIDLRVEHAARVFGANNRRLFHHVLAPLLVPGLLAAGVLTLVRVVGQFELTFLVSGPDIGGDPEPLWRPLVLHQACRVGKSGSG